MAISARLTIELYLVQAEKSSSQSKLINDLFRNFPIAFSKANITQISALVNLALKVQPYCAQIIGHLLRRLLFRWL